MKFPKGSELDVSTARHTHAAIGKNLRAIKATGSEQSRRHIQTHAVGGDDGTRTGLYSCVENYVIE